MTIEYYIMTDEDLVPRRASLPFPTVEDAYRAKYRAADYIVAVEDGVERFLTADEEASKQPGV
jgi:hypothetical protein